MNRRILTIVLVALFLGVACGDDNTGGNNIFTTPNSGDDGGMTTPDAGMSDDSGMPDSGDTVDTGLDDAGVDMGLQACDLVNCLPSQDCEEGVCIDREPCAEAIDAGTLVEGTPVNFEGSFLESGSDAATSSCGEDGQLEQLIRFELTEEAEVSWAVDWGEQFDGLVAIQTACDDATTEVVCSDFENDSATLGPGIYYLVLEVRIGNAGDFSVELASGPPATCNAGEATCVGDDRELCTDGFNIQTETCPLTCSQGACAGDSCGAPITITAPGGTYSGSGQAMTNQLDYAGNIECAQLAGMATSTPGYDVVFFLPNLFPGQVVSIDARTNDGNINDIFVQQTCGDTNMCTASYQNGEQPDFVVQSAGDYFVIIEKRQASNAPFEYTISIQ
jgi:hypothetical protein